MSPPDASNKRRIRRHFGQHAPTYDEAAVLQKEVNRRLLERLDFIKIQPHRILDLGTGTGWALQELKQRYPAARLLAMDVSRQMLERAQKKSGWFRKIPCICGDAEQLPLADASMDLVFSSLMLQWCDAEKVFAEVRRVLRPGGLFLFTSFGPDTLKELKASWARVDTDVHINDFTDMHDLGDWLLQSGLHDPVMDMELIQLTYEHALDLMKDLRAIGANTPIHKQPGGLVTPGRLNRVIRAYEAFRDPRGLLPASYEILYGHGWCLERQEQVSPTEFTVPLNQLGRKRD